MKAALVIPFLPHLPFHPSYTLGYGTAILAGRYDLEVIDLNAELHSKNRGKLKLILDVMDNTQIVSDILHLYPFYDEVDTYVDRHYVAIPWKKYPLVYVTPPSWFPMVLTEDVLRLSRAIKRVSVETKIFFFGNSLGSWTDEKKLRNHDIQIRHLNALFKANPVNEPIDYDSLPTPIYEQREKYLFDILPFRLKHGCIWGKCRFCSLAKGWNAGYKERSAKKIIQEIGELIDQYNPQMLVGRDNSINGSNLLEFCTSLENFKKPWVGMARADLSDKEIEALQRSGCRFIYFGLESGSDRVLDGINKGIGAKQMSRFIKALAEHNIMPAPSVFVGSPGETEEDFEKTVKFILDHKDYLDFINLYPLRMTPASYFSHTKQAPDKNTPIRLTRLIHVCEDAGIKVCVGEQSAEYVLFNRVYPGHVNY